ncbi:38k [Clostera anastomosis granulovirus A]|uniref:38k n=1 Tax=Clostera anastomosis granulovirus A TaxID=1986289 RepID=U5KBU8_9BBAC|nr:38k [Clostera anastomosis granulovirus Henan]AGQ20334.1 38k [Clostera anastomosis granulovirus Henan]
MERRWTVLHNNWSLVKRHILMIDKYEDLRSVNTSTLIKFEFVVFDGPPTRDCVCDTRFRIRSVLSRDEMKDFRANFKSTFRLSYLGDMFTLFTRPAVYNLLKEWLVHDVYDINKIATTDVVFFDPPHVVVFDMDSTLITEEQEVRIRDDAIYKSLDDLKRLNCVLCLWSYGDREHVVHSLDKVKLNGYFDIILAEGRRVGEYHVSEEEDVMYEVYYKSTPFYLDITDTKNIPKSPRVVLWYLQKYKVGFFKTITLVDDLYDNNINYDNFVNLKTCPVPVNDWDKWQRQIERFIKADDERRCER